MLRAFLINKMILDMYLCKFVFTSIKSDVFSAVLVHLEVRSIKFRIYRCHPVMAFASIKHCITRMDEI